MQNPLCKALAEISLNGDVSRVKPKLKASSPRKVSSTESQSFAEEAAPTSRRQRVFKLEHVDSMMLPSLNGISAKSYEQEIEQVVELRNLVRATPKRTAKKELSYRIAEILTIEDEQVEESDWSELPKSDDPGECSLLEDVSPRQLWPPPTRKLVVAKEVDVVDLTSPKKNGTRQSKQNEAIPWRRRSLSSSSDDSLAILRLSVSIIHKRMITTNTSSSPPRSKSPRKAPPPPVSPSRPSTPPLHPSKSRLNSPTKAHKVRVPPTPHRSSLDAFWSQEAVNAWTDEYFPKKILASPRKHHYLSSQPPSTSEIPVEDDDIFTPKPMITPSTPRKSPTKSSTTAASRAVAATRKAFDTTREAIATDFLTELDTKITGGNIARLTASTGGVKIIWSNKLNTTAGRANWKCETIRSRLPTCSTTPSTTDGLSNVAETITYNHHASIELATKVITDPPRLLNVLAHEFCHLANFIISRVRDQPHGASFKEWARKVTREFANRGIEVTTKHSYEIAYKYAWGCVGAGGAGDGAFGAKGCGMEYQRHSRSIDPKRHTCGNCKGRLVQVRPVPRPGTLNDTNSSSSGKAGEMASQAGERPGNQSAYQVFVKENFNKVREDLGMQSPMKDVMREVGVRYRAGKGDASPTKQSSAETTGTGNQPASPTKNKSERIVEVIEIDDDEVDDVDDTDELQLVLPELGGLTIRDD
jgi:predicted SprT family Zn-dependent metalloprotease